MSTEVSDLLLVMRQTKKFLLVETGTFPTQSLTFFAFSKTEPGKHKAFQDSLFVHNSCYEKESRNQISKLKKKAF
jgi:hypothetical protein